MHHATRSQIDEWTTSLAQLRARATESTEIRGLGALDADERDLRALVDSYIAATDSLSDSVGILSQDDTKAMRAVSAVAAGDFEAAQYVLVIASTYEADTDQRLLAVAPLESDLDGYAGVLLGTGVSGAADPPAWKEALAASLEKVSEDAVDRLGDFAKSSAVTAAASSFLPAATKLFGGAFASVVERAREVLGWLKGKALDLVRRAMDKIVSLFGDDVKKAINKFVEDKVAGLPSDVMAFLSGHRTTIDAWAAAAKGGRDLDALTPAVASSETEHLRHLKWADRASDVLQYVAPAISAAAVLAGAGPIAVAALALAIAGWMVWASWDHSHDCRRLLAAG